MIVLMWKRSEKLLDWDLGWSSTQSGSKKDLFLISELIQRIFVAVYGFVQRRILNKQYEHGGWSDLVQGGMEVFVSPVSSGLVKEDSASTFNIITVKM